MKAPDWLVVEMDRDATGELVCRVRVRRWHPRFWWLVATWLWQRARLQAAARQAVAPDHDGVS